MEKSEKINFSGRPKEEMNKGDTYGAGCPFWFFGNEDSADRDLKEKFEIKDEEDSNK